MDLLAFFVMQTYRLTNITYVEDAFFFPVRAIDIFFVNVVPSPFAESAYLL